MASVMTALAIGQIVSPTLVALGVDGIGWRRTFLSEGIVVSGVTVLGCLGLRSRPEDVGLEPYGVESSHPAPDLRVRDTLRTRLFWVMVLGGVAAISAATASGSAWGPSRFCQCWFWTAKWVR